jgi:hypothetical protein
MLFNEVWLGASQFNIKFVGLFGSILIEIFRGAGPI